MRRFILMTAAIPAAVFLWLLGTLPSLPAAADGEAQVDAGVRARTVAGAFHVHSTRSDGSGEIDEIAAAAGRAGLRFVVMTDHGDATRQPDPPAYRHGVLVIDAVEISTNGGHYIAVDMPAAPYPLGGEAPAVVEDVSRLGGFGIVAHPDSAKTALRWSDWNLAVDGIEWLNLDSEWRDESRARLARIPFDYLLRAAPALASMLDRPSATLERWDAIAARRPLVAFLAHDAHGGIAEGQAGGMYRVPSYESSFRAFAMRAVLDAAPSGAAETDARLILDAMRTGRVFSAIDAVAAPAFIDFRATSGGRDAVMGQTLPFVERAGMSVRSTLPAGGNVVLFRDGTEIARSTSNDFVKSADAPGAYRVEIHAPASPGSPPVPWIVSNPIYLRHSDNAPGGPPSPAASVVVAPVDDAGRVEKDPLSTASLGSDPGTRALTYSLGAGERTSQFAAIAIRMPPVPGAFDSLVFTGRAVAPMRISVQLRFNDLGGARWAHSVYLAPESRRVEVALNKLIPVDGASAAPRFTSASSILFVVDLTNAKPGQSGRFEISALSLASSQRGVSRLRTAAER